jgi:hypothetical protein
MIRRLASSVIPRGMLVALMALALGPTYSLSDNPQTKQAGSEDKVPKAADKARPWPSLRSPGDNRGSPRNPS